jgi:hypothetical protein
MSRQPLSQFLMRSVAIATIGLIVLAELPALARPMLSGSASNQLLARRGQSRRGRVKFKVGAKPSRYRVGGFSRNSQCGVGSGAQVVAPPEKAGDRAAQKNVDFLEQTTAAKPTFFVYLPQETASRAKLTVQNEDRTEQLDRVTFDLNAPAGIVAIPMSAKGKSLEVGQKYLWQMTIYCDSSAKSASVTLNGWVERVKSEGSIPENPEERVGFYADRGIWQDAMMSLVEMKGSDPDWSANWAELMDSAELGKLRNADVVQVVSSL